MVSQKNMGLRKFWPDLEISEAFVILWVSKSHFWRFCLAKSQIYHTEPLEEQMHAQGGKKGKTYAIGKETLHLYMNNYY